MDSPINKIAIIGSGVIGAGWTIRLLAKNKIVYVYDHDSSQYKFLKSEIWWILNTKYWILNNVNILYKTGLVIKIQKSTKN